MFGKGEGRWGEVLNGGKLALECTKVELESEG